MTRHLLLSLVVFISLPVVNIAGDDPEKEIQELIELVDRVNAQKSREKWVYERLVDDADLVVIGKFSNSQPIKLTKHDKESDGWFEGIVGVESQFTVLAVVKTADLNKERPDTIPLVHFKFEGPLLNLSGQQFLDFTRPTYDRDNQITIVSPEGNYLSRSKEYRRVDQEWRYLLFLKKRPDGRYEPVSGQFFPDLSVKKVED